MKEPVSKETVDLVLRAQRSITKIENGPAVAGFLNVEDIAALTWAVLEVTNLYLFSKEPLSEKDMAKAQEIAERYRSGDPAFKPVGS